MEQILMSNRDAIEIKGDFLGAGPSAGLCFRVVSSWKVLGPGKRNSLLLWLPRDSDVAGAHVSV